MQTVLDRSALQTKPPQMHQVMLINDDYTPMEFVVDVLRDIFYKDGATATLIMLKIHTQGKGVCGVFTPDVAQSKVQKVMQAAQKQGHPLQCISEPIN